MDPVLVHVILFVDDEFQFDEDVGSVIVIDKGIDEIVKLLVISYIVRSLTSSIFML